MDLKSPSANWRKLQASGRLKKDVHQQPNSATNYKQGLKPSHSLPNLKRKSTAPVATSHRDKKPKLARNQRDLSTIRANAKASVMQSIVEKGTLPHEDEQCTNDGINEGMAKSVDIGKYVAIDCEMVGVGPHPHLESALARVSVVNYNGEQVYDSYVKPQEEVTDWRTHVSGIQPKHMIHARSFEEVQNDIASLLNGRIVVGHSVRSDFEALMLDHPKRDIRDTARHPPYRKLAGGGSPKLKILASGLLGLDIQAGEHSSIEDARATMSLFRRDKDAFEREHIKKWGPAVITKKVVEVAVDGEASKKPKKKKKKKKQK